MAGVIDIRDNPMVDMAMAQTIGNIFKAIGQAEQNRQKRHQIDSLMGQMSGGASPEQAIQAVRTNPKPGYDKGPLGVLQRVGGVISSTSPQVDITEDFTEQLLLNKMRQADPLYQAQLKATQTATEGQVQRQAQDRDMFPIEKEGAETLNTARKQQITQQADLFPIEKEGAKLAVEGKRMQNEQAAVMMPYEQQNAALDLFKRQRDYQWGQEDRDLAIKRDAIADSILLLRREGLINDAEYNEKMQPLLIDAQKAENKYREALTTKTQTQASGTDQRNRLIRQYQMIMKGATNEYGEVNPDQQDIYEDAKAQLEALRSEQTPSASGQTQVTTGQAPAGPYPQVVTDADFDALPSGQLFQSPDGKTRRKP